MGFFKLTANFGPYFIRLINLLYQDVESTVINFGYTSEWFKLRRAVRQGCPASPVQFLLIVEILGQQIRQRQNPQSIFIDRRKLHSQNADDIWVAIKANRENLDTLMRIFEDFCSFSGLKINYDKTQVLRLGSLKDSDAQIYTQKPLNWVKEITVLGVKFSTNSCMMIQNNYQAIMQKLRGLCTCWSNRSLTLIGKVLVVNPLLVSQFFYKF